MNVSDIKDCNYIVTVELLCTKFDYTKCDFINNPRKMTKIKSTIVPTIELIT